MTLAKGVQVTVTVEAARSMKLWRSGDNQQSSEWYRTGKVTRLYRTGTMVEVTLNDGSIAWVNPKDLEVAK